MGLKENTSPSKGPRPKSDFRVHRGVRLTLDVLVLVIKQQYNAALSTTHAEHQVHQLQESCGGLLHELLRLSKRTAITWVLHVQEASRQVR